MIKNYLVTIFRQIKKHKLFSFINVFGLALGMAACIFIAQYVNFHSSFDKFHTNADRIFRIESETSINGAQVGRAIKAPSPMSQMLLEQSVHVEKVARFYPYNYANSTLVYEHNGDKINLEQKGIYGAEPSLFEVFDFELAEGSYKNFNQPQKAIVSYELAQKLFGSANGSVGQTFALSNNTSNLDYQIIGVMDQLPENSHIQFELLISYPSLDNYTEARTNWGYNSMITYLLIDDSENTAAIIEDMNRLFDEHAAADFAKAGYDFDYHLMALPDLHLGTINIVDFTLGIDKRIVIAMTLIAVIILIIAWINYMNLSFVRTMERLKEIGIRKCMGSNIKQVTQLFILEALVMNALAFGVAIIINQLADQPLRALTGLPESAIAAPKVLAFLGVLIVLGTLVIGLYPYALLKSVKISSVLVGKKGKMGSSSMRKALVFAQFIITFLLIAGTLTIYNQNTYMRKADLKIDIENVLVIQSPPGLVSTDEDSDNSERQDVKRFNTLKTELLKYPNITAITNAGEMPGEQISWGTSLRLKNNPDDVGIVTSLISMDTDFPAFFDIEVVAGRALQRGDDPWTKGDVVINEKLAEMLGFDDPAEAVGAALQGFYAPLTVRGVLENHHHTSLHDDFSPIAYILSSWTEYYFIRYNLDETATQPLHAQLDDLVATIENEWNAVYTDYQMDYSFLDQNFDAQYQEDIRFGKIFGGFSILAIVIACLGLFGLTSFTIQQRKKEIGIRKVLGAGMNNLIQLLAKDYLLLVGIACIVSIPISRWLMAMWLENFPFSISLGWWFYLVPATMVLLLAILSIVSKIVSTAKTNPVESLRYE